MKNIRYLAIGLLAIGLIAAGLGGSFFISGTTASRPAKTFEDYMRDAEVYKDDNSYYKAIVSYESALEKEENNADALMGLAEVYSKKADYDKEMEIRRQIAELVPDNLENRERIIEILIHNKDFDTAKKETEDVLASYDSEEISKLYELMNVEAPRFNLSSGEYDEYQLLRLETADANSIVRYTLDGSEPGPDSPVWPGESVISYTDNEVRAIAYSSLGFPSEETDLKITITKPVETVLEGGSYVNDDMWILRNLLNKSYSSDVYNYELAQIREIYSIGNYYVSQEKPEIVYYQNSYSYYGYTYDYYGGQSLDFVQYTPFLKTLVLGYQERTDLAPLSSLQYLENLSLCNCSVEDISPLGECKSLKRLALGWNSISDISPVESLTNLESLGLWNNSIEDISPVSGLKKLNYLDVANNNVSNIDAVSGLTELTEVWINGNQIENISPLDNCTKLGVLMLAQNPISEYGTIRDRAEKLYKTDLER